MDPSRLTWSGLAAGSPLGWCRTVAATVRLTEGSLATSGNSERGHDGRGHILDPSDGRPAEDFGSVTVSTRDPLAADCLSTALFVMGPDAGMRWVEGRAGVEAVFMVRRPDGGVLLSVSSGLSDRLVEVSGTTSVSATTEMVLNSNDPLPRAGVSGG